MKKRRLKKKIRSAERKRRYCTQAQHLGKLFSRMQLVLVWAGEKMGVGRAEERGAEGKGEGKMGWRRSGERVGQQGVGKNRVKKPPEKGVEKRPGKGG